MAAGYEMRVSDAEREAAAAEVREHFASGRLDQEELNERLSAVFAARTRGDLTAVFTDLPSTGNARAGAGAPGTGPAFGGPFGPRPFGPGPSGTGPFGTSPSGGQGRGGSWQAGIGRGIGRIAFTGVLMWALFIVGMIAVFGGLGGGRPFGIVLLLAAFALLRRLLFMIFGRRRGGGRRGRGPRRRRLQPRPGSPREQDPLSEGVPRETKSLSATYRGGDRTSDQTGSAMPMRYYAPFPGGGGDTARPRGPHALRIGDAERDAVATDLGEHYAAGRLTLDELHERLDAVFSAKTLGQLTRIMADLPGQGRLAWRSAWHGAGPHGGWDPAVFPYAHLGMAGRPWPGAGLPDPGPQSGETRAQSTPADRAGRFAALSLLLIAMLIWLFTALLFARHGSYYHGPGFQPGSTMQYIQHLPQNGSFQNGPGAP